MLIQIDKLVQLLESPVFTCLFLFIYDLSSDSSLTLSPLQTSAFNSLSQKNTPICTSVSTVSSCSSLKVLPLLPSRTA